MPLEADEQKVPVNDDGDLSVSEEQAFADKVAKYRAQLENPDWMVDANAESAQQLADLVAAADAAVEAPGRPQKRPDGPIAPVRRGKAPATPLRKIGTFGGMEVIEDPSVPHGEPVMLPKRTRKPRPPAPVVTSQLEDISDEELLREAGVVPSYSTTEAAQFFDRTNQWLYWGLGRDDDQGMPVFVHPDGLPIAPERIGDPETGRRRFTLQTIKDILLSSYRRGNIEPDELKKILRRIRINELGGEWREREGWRKVRGKWVHPDQCEFVGGAWVRKKKEPSGSDDGLRSE